jgi:hypothetical protein
MDELQRVDLLVRAQTVRWMMHLGGHKAPGSWGMLNVSPEEVKAYLASEFTLPGLPPLSSGSTRPERAPADELAERYVAAAERAAHDIEASRARTPPEVILRLDRLAQTCGLNRGGRDVLLVCLLAEHDARYRRLFAYLQDDASKTRPTVELLFQILGPVVTETSALRALIEPRAPLLACHLLLLSGDAQGEEALPWRQARLDDRAAAYLLGDDALDGRLAGLANLYRYRREPIPWSRLHAGPDQIARLRELTAWLAARRAHGERAAVLLLHGPRGSAQFPAARVMTAELGLDLLYVAVAAALRSPAGWPRVVDLAIREAQWCQAALFWSGADLLLDRDQPTHFWDALLAASERFPGLTFLASQAAWHPSARFRTTPFLNVEFPMPSFEARVHLWKRLLPPDAEFAEPPPPRDALAEELANGFQLTEGQVLDAVSGARWLAVTRCPAWPRLKADDLFEACRRQSGQRLSSFARRIEPRRGLDFNSLIVPPATLQQLRELWHRIHLRSRLYSTAGMERRITLGRGTVALFTGSSGTGKTMAAELLANLERVDLYKVDLSAVVSKWVGETEKNLAAIFAEAQDANAVILFDEADALFSKRGEVKEAQDRWANLEANFLLQRIEEYTGAVILTSNLRQNIDDAFLRRIHVSIEFPLPDADSRLKIWQGLFPPGMGRPDAASVEDLATRFELTGGNIRNIVIDAAFRALAEADPSLAGEPDPSQSQDRKPPVITLLDLVLSVAREYQKLGRAITRTEFSTRYYQWIEKYILMRTPAS